MEFRPCFLVPCFNHGKTIPALLDALAAFHLPVIIVDDGSDADTKTCLAEESRSRDKVMLVTLDANQGKGAAVIAGMRRAEQEGFSHALQIDADGQHNTGDVPAMLDAAQQNPGDLVSGRPLFDASIPRIRYYGRYITHFWVWVHTLSFSIKDSMCGFRVYPVAPFTRLLQAGVRVGRRMDFDTEIMVRLYWSGCRVHFVETKVVYPEGGISHFDFLRDNLLITGMHFRLFFGMLPRARGLLRRNREHRHWSSRSEHGTVIGIKFLLLVYTLLGRRVFGWLLRPVMLYYYVIARAPRAASRDYLRRLTARAERLQQPLPEKITSFKHFLAFGYTILDNLVAWRGDFKADDVVRHGLEHYEQIIQRKQGVVILASHLGSMEVCRAMSHLLRRRKVNALVFTRHAERFNSVMKAINPDSNINLIQAHPLGPDTAILLKQKLEAGEWVVLVGDRTSITHEERVVWADFLGDPAPFPQGPFLLAAMLQEPVYMMFGLRDDRGGKPVYHIHFEQFSESLALPRDRREEVLKEVVTRYAQRLEYHALRAPLQWYNFFDFWSLSKSQHE